MESWTSPAGFEELSRLLSQSWGGKHAVGGAQDATLLFLHSQPPPVMNGRGKQHPAARWRFGLLGASGILLKAASITSEAFH
ncbi:hypothetical protein E2C01_032927 [Portunus trituberculatus]|uniref:Uncharacterized protein n=1 Tax=Portunus trituberculatus TaxID=210409 RepID=A0A5B7EYS2_PORTR|nr:hypothetical protein [Portunus trituberculatus]